MVVGVGNCMASFVVVVLGVLSTHFPLIVVISGEPHDELGLDTPFSCAATGTAFIHSMLAVQGQAGWQRSAVIDGKFSQFWN